MGDYVGVFTKFNNPKVRDDVTVNILTKDANHTSYEKELIEKFSRAFVYNCCNQDFYTDVFDRLNNEDYFKLESVKNFIQNKGNLEFIDSSIVYHDEIEAILLFFAAIMKDGEMKFTFEVEENSGSYYDEGSCPYWDIEVLPGKTKIYNYVCDHKTDVIINTV